MKYLVDYYFDVPGKPFPGVVTVGVLGQASPVVPGGLGWLKGISPEETRHAFLFAVARDIKKELPVGPWKQVALSVIMECQFLESEEDYFWEMGEHEDPRVDWSAVRDHVLQLCPGLSCYWLNRVASPDCVFDLGWRMPLRSSGFSRSWR